MKEYTFLQASPPEKDVEQQTIVAKEEVYRKNDVGEYEVSETKEEKFTIAQMEEELANIDRQIADLNKRREEKVAEIAEIKKALGV